MKVTFSRNVKHDGKWYNQGETYEFEGELTPELQSLLDLTHEDVFTQKSTEEAERRVEVKVAEVVPDETPAQPQPAPMQKTAPLGGNPMMPPTPNV
jgi:hypothetical protein